MDAARSRVCRSASTELISGRGVPARTAMPTRDRTRSTRLPAMTSPRALKSSSADRARITRSAGSWRARRLGMVSAPLPIDAPKVSVMVWPVARSNTGANCTDASVKPPDVNTRTSSAATAADSHRHAMISATMFLARAREVIAVICHGFGCTGCTGAQGALKPEARIEHESQCPPEISGPRLQRKFSGDVRLHGLRLLRLRDRRRIFSQRQSVRVADAGADDVWRRLPDAPARRDRARRLCGQVRAAGRPRLDVEPDVDRHRVHCLRARIPHHRTAGAV